MDHEPTPFQLDVDGAIWTAQFRPRPTAAGRASDPSRSPRPWLPLITGFFNHPGPDTYGSLPPRVRFMSFRARDLSCPEQHCVVDHANHARCAEVQAGITVLGHIETALTVAFEAPSVSNHLQIQHPAFACRAHQCLACTASRRTSLSAWRGTRPTRAAFGHPGSTSSAMSLTRSCRDHLFFQ
jgi:hypothetical protein